MRVPRRAGDTHRHETGAPLLRRLADTGVLGGGDAAPRPPLLRPGGDVVGAVLGGGGRLCDARRGARPAATRPCHPRLAPFVLMFGAANGMSTLARASSI